MSDVEFERLPMSAHPTFVPKPQGFSAYLIKNGWAHDTSSANKLMVFLAILFTLASTIVYYVFVGGANAQKGKINIPNHVLERLPLETREKIRDAQQ